MNLSLTSKNNSNKEFSLQDNSQAKGHSLEQLYLNNRIPLSTISAEDIEMENQGIHAA